METSTYSPAPAASGASPVLLFVYWVVVGIPLAWGVFQTAQKSVPLFHVTAAPVVAAPPAK